MRYLIAVDTDIGINRLIILYMIISVWILSRLERADMGVYRYTYLDGGEYLLLI